MKISPSLEKAKAFAAAGDYKVLPVSAELLSDFTTPIEVLRILKNVSPPTVICWNRHRQTKPGADIPFWALIPNWRSPAGMET